MEAGGKVEMDACTPKGRQLRVNRAVSLADPSVHDGTFGTTHALLRAEVQSKRVIFWLFQRSWISADLPYIPQHRKNIRMNILVIR
jgi:hypothetical protein